MREVQTTTSEYYLIRTDYNNTILPFENSKHKKTCLYNRKCVCDTCFLIEKLSILQFVWMKFNALLNVYIHAKINEEYYGRLNAIELLNIFHSICAILQKKKLNIFNFLIWQHWCKSKVHVRIKRPGSGEAQATFQWSKSAWVAYYTRAWKA